MKRLLPLMISFAFSACFLSNEKKDQINTTMHPENFIATIDSKPVQLYVLKNKNGMEVSITNYGATVVSMLVPDKSGKMVDVVLGYDSVSTYQNGTSYFGAIAGRYANRIAKGKFNLGDTSYTLAVNNGVNALHGGIKGYNKVVWEAKKEENVLKLSYFSKDGEEGYPGNVKVSVIYTLTDSNALDIQYQAETDKPTIINLTNHNYFNLEGQGSGTILGHQLMLNADRFTPVDSTLIPTGELASVKGTPFDFTVAHSIGEHIYDTLNQQIKFGLGYDHNFVLNGAYGKLQLAATVKAPINGIEMKVYTTEPGIQFYSGNFLNGNDKGKGSVYDYRTGICLETQHFPDSPNQPSFPSVVLKPGEIYKTQTTYRFN
jgi:aldose 1-epimerase